MSSNQLVVLTKQQERALKKAEERVNDAKRIKLANIELVNGTAPSNDLQMFSPPRKKEVHAIINYEDMKPAFRIGDYVKIEQDTSPGMNRPDGFGFVQSVRGCGAATLTDVKYDLCYDNGRIHKNISVEYITPVIFGAEEYLPEQSTNERVIEINDDLDEKSYNIVAPLSVEDALIKMLESSVKEGKPKGFHRRDLGLNPNCLKNDMLQRTKLNSLEKAQLFAESRVLNALNKNICGQRRYIDTGKRKKGKFDVKDKVDPLTLTYLLTHCWGVGKNRVSSLRKEIFNSAIENGMNQETASILMQPIISEDQDKVLTVIDSQNVCDKVFNVKRYFVYNWVREKGTGKGLGVEDMKSLRRDANEAFQSLDINARKLWNMKTREHNDLRPSIEATLIRSIQKNNSVTYEQLESKIKFWCSSATIRRWLTSRDGFKVYKERITPLLSDQQKQKHFSFARRFMNNWGLGGGNYLLINYDEKWFYGMVTKSIAKVFDGIERTNLKAYHKSHINKTMTVAFTAYAFKDRIDNGGDGIKLGFFRAQSYKVAKRAVRQNVRQSDGSLRAIGPIIRKKGDLYLVDCAVTGDNMGTPEDPKFSLKALFEKTIFPSIGKLVERGGKYEGYKVIIQGDNAGPHQEQKYLDFVNRFCEQKGWHWEPQAPQMPHMNNLDLSVFPCMSGRHCQLAREKNGLRMLKEDEIWENAKSVWDDLPSCNIASGFVQAYRIAKKVIDINGDNSFLNGSKIHTGNHQDFEPTSQGLKRKDELSLPPPP